MLMLAYQQVIGVTADGKQFDKEDAQLQGFGDGTPRFYVMRLPRCAASQRGLGQQIHTAQRSALVRHLSKVE